MTKAIPSCRAFLTRLAASPIAVAEVGTIPNAGRARGSISGIAMLRAIIMALPNRQAMAHSPRKVAPFVPPVKR